MIGVPNARLRRAYCTTPALEHATGARCYTARCPRCVARPGQGGCVEQLLPIIVGLAILWVVWKVVKGVIRLVLTLLVIAAVLYFVLPLLGLM